MSDYLVFTTKMVGILVPALSIFSRGQMRDFRKYHTGNETVDNALNQIHLLTMRDSEDWRIAGALFDDWLISFISAVELLPKNHPVRLKTLNVYTRGQHMAWSEDETAHFYKNITAKIWPTLDQIKDISPDQETKPDPLLDEWRLRAKNAFSIRSKWDLCQEIANSRSSPFPLKDAARKASVHIHPYINRVRLTLDQEKSIEQKFAWVELNL
ncbi:hypothetical protein ACFQ3K_03385 [Brucella gallinifaecis]|uniref:Uncharacterized protein n=1 Tax=Brucella gallinifaecis TaxID=215590 RepID=A0A502BPH9_9HYPH|nr:hypothetical protein [Brucella gallinifaecis]TPF75196.1 hypothetical protein FHY56_10795 [Brucella gallinifaecis]